MAISAAILDGLAAQIQGEADHNCVPDDLRVQLIYHQRGIRRAAERLYEASLPGKASRPRLGA